MKQIVVANWKMKLGVAESITLASGIAERFGRFPGEIWLAPTFLAIPQLISAVHGSEIQIGAQNVHWEQNGAFTGEVSGAALKECGATFAIVGHSERRNILAELPPIAAQRALGALRADLSVIFCIGETLSKRQAAKTFKILDEQLTPFLEQISDENAKRVLLAYEPVWAIGTGEVATREQILEAHEYVARVWDEFIPDIKPRILYGGSVSGENIREILSIPHVDGVLVSSSSLSIDKFGELITGCLP